MKLVILICSVAALLAVGGFVFFAMTDVPVPQTTVSKTLPNERFFNES